MEPPSQHRVEIVDETSQGGFVHDSLRRAVAAALDAEGVGASEVAVLLTDDDRVHVLNRDFRGVDDATDVLTFPSGEDAGGDLAIAVPYAVRQAERRGVPLDTELVYLAIHGALHLCGLDDATEEEANEMRRRMSRVAVSIGFPPDDAWGSLLHEESASC